MTFKPIDIDHLTNKSLKDIIDFVYENYFKNDFMDRDVRSKLNGKFIYLPMNFIEYKPERFWHIISFQDEDSKYTVKPCTNLELESTCLTYKSDCCENLSIPHYHTLTNRSECLYRLQRIHWINKIIKLANNSLDPRLNIWVERSYDNKKRVEYKKYIRFKDLTVDYIIILRKTPNSYVFITAFPVTTRKAKKNYSKKYNKNK